MPRTEKEATAEDWLDLASDLAQRLDKRGLGADRTQVHVLAYDIENALVALRASHGVVPEAERLTAEEGQRSGIVPGPDPLRVTEAALEAARPVYAEAFPHADGRLERAPSLDHLREILEAALPHLVPKPEMTKAATHCVKCGEPLGHPVRSCVNPSCTLSGLAAESCNFCGGSGYYAAEVGSSRATGPCPECNPARPKPEGVEGDPLEWAWELLEKAGYPEAALEARDAWRPYRDRQLTPREDGRE